jgi:hypothetical protein
VKAEPNAALADGYGIAFLHRHLAGNPGMLLNAPGRRRCADPFVSRLSASHESTSDGRASYERHT